jgi:hypothetical protein
MKNERWESRTTGRSVALQATRKLRTNANQLLAKVIESFRNAPFGYEVHCRLPNRKVPVPALHPGTFDSSFIAQRHPS